MADESPARITRVVLKNYKSIVSCDVELRPLTILVGPNGSGKSNFLDALSFAKQALVLGPDQAIRNRGNTQLILSATRPADENSFSIALEFRLSRGGEGSYEFEVQVMPDGDFTIRRERLVVSDVQFPAGPELFSIEEDGARMWARPEVADKYPLTRDRLYLTSYAAMPEARPIVDLLSSMAFFNPVPSEMRVLRPHDSGGRLVNDGSNIASVVRRIKALEPETLWGLMTYLSRIMPGLERIDSEELGGFDALTFRQGLSTGAAHIDFQQSQVSDGTIRALAVLVALFQHRTGGRSETSLVGIEEPEAGLHPAAARVILNAMLDASITTQVLATTHSADMLHMGEIDLDSLVAVSAENGVSRIGPIDDVSRSIVNDQLYTVGELLQMDQIRPRDGAGGSNGQDATPQPSVGRS